MGTVRVLELFAGVKVKVSDKGEIFTLDHTGVRSDGRPDNRKGRKLRPALDRYGYERVVLSNGRERHTFLVHRLVAMAFIENPFGKPTVNHKNGIKNDNSVGNLEWATHSEQKRHSIRTHLCDKNIKALELANKRSSRKVMYMGNMFESIRAASRAMGVSQYEICKRGEFL